MTVVNVLKAPEALVANDREQAAQNTKHIAEIMASLPGGGAVYFPAGDYYFQGVVLILPPGQHIIRHFRIVFPIQWSEKDNCCKNP